MDGISRRLAFAGFVHAAVVLIAAAPLHAQRVTGRVIEEGSGQGIGFTQVSLIASDTAVAARTLADSAGFFVLDGRIGSFRLRAERLGYATVVSDTIVMQPGEVIDVLLRLSAQAVALAPLEIRARGGLEKGRFGFERRRAMGKGWFMTEDSIMAREPAVATDAFHAIPRVNVSFRGQISSWTGAKCLRIFLDNVPIALRRGGEDLNLFTAPERIRAIEVYRDWYEVPHELRTAGRLFDLTQPRQIVPCGLVWVWTDNGW
jgi:hypothetical protein